MRRPLTLNSDTVSVSASVTATCVRYQTRWKSWFLFFPQPNLNNLAKLVIRLFFW